MAIDQREGAALLEALAEITAATARLAARIERVEGIVRRANAEWADQQAVEAIFPGLGSSVLERLHAQGKVRRWKTGDGQGCRVLWCLDDIRGVAAAEAQ